MISSFKRSYRMFSTEKSFEKILVANRGEIACRIFRTCKKLGIKTVAVHSLSDANSLHVDLADESVCIGPSASSESYLQIDRIVQACRMTGAQAVHPGYGFLSENNNFAKALEDSGIAFIGPKSHAIDIMGDKIKSKTCALEANVNCIPGDSKIVKNIDECLKESNLIGYPVMIKASAGGGGKGMRIAWNDNEAIQAFRLSSAESLASFGDDRLFVEKFIEQPRHIEIQILADGFGNCLWLNERECSIQRRNQKIMEEAPSVVLDQKLRKEMGEQACQLARAVNYQSAGTVEFLIDKDKNFYFLEMNTRLQVEHPVTEYITGIDLVEQMINVAYGKQLTITQNDVGITGWAIESRVYAEDPFKGFLPSIGTLNKYIEPLPLDKNVRSDSGIKEGSEISIFYDPMICKLICYGTDRKAALEKTREALDSYVIHGVKNNVAFLRELCDHKKFINGDITTKFIEEEYPDGFKKPDLDLTTRNVLSLSSSLLRLTETKSSSFVITIDEKEDAWSWTVSCKEVKDKMEIKIDDQILTGSLEYDSVSTIAHLYVNKKKEILQVLENNEKNSYMLQYRGYRYKVDIRTPKEEEEFQKLPKPIKIDHTKFLYAPMPGKVISLSIKIGQKIEENQEVCIIEAMKMQTVFKATKSGIIKEINVNEDEMINDNQLIYSLE